MKQIPYLTQLTKLPTSIEVQNGWGVPGSDWLSPVIIERWLKEGLIEFCGERRVRLTEEGKKIAGRLT